MGKETKRQSYSADCHACESNWTGLVVENAVMDTKPINLADTPKLLLGMFRVRFECPACHRRITRYVVPA